jgi:hypothetical protein
VLDRRYNPAFAPITPILRREDLPVNDQDHVHLQDSPTPRFHLPVLPILRARVTMRLLEAATLPRYKGAMLRGGFGYAFQRASCPRPCWGHSDQCAVATLCPYRWVLETPHPPHIQHLHNLRDVPRPFVIEPPLDGHTRYDAGAALEFGLVLIGRGIDYLPYFLFGFEQLGRLGLGRYHARARLERVKALAPWQPVGQVIYRDGHALTDPRSLPLVEAASISIGATQLPADLRLIFRTPLRLKTQGDWLRRIDPVVIVQAVCWRLNALTTFHGGAPWGVDYRLMVEQARAITVEDACIQWVDWERTSTREAQPRKMMLGGIVGSAVLRNVPPDLRAVLLAGSLVHVGKACVFGHGAYEVLAAHCIESRRRT